MFQQRHFEAIAQMMQEIDPQADNLCKRQHIKTINALSTLFARHNPNFMLARFERACEPGANVRARGNQRAHGSGYSPTSHGR